MATATKKKAAPATTKAPSARNAPARKAAATKPVPAPSVPASTAPKAAAPSPTAKAKVASKESAPAKTRKPEKLKKPKLVRDSFTMPKTEYAVLQALKDRAAKAGAPARKTELLRAGIQALAAMQDGAFLAALAAVPALKTGRPAKG